MLSPSSVKRLNTKNFTSLISRALGNIKPGILELEVALAINERVCSPVFFARRHVLGTVLGGGGQSPVRPEL